MSLATGLAALGCTERFPREQERAWVRGRGGRKEGQNSKTVLSTVGRKKNLKIEKVWNSDEYIKLLEYSPVTAEVKGESVLGFMFTEPSGVPAGPIQTD